MELDDCEEVLRVLDDSFARINWRLKPSIKRRFQTDILMLCTGMRPVILVDYGGIMPKLQDDLCSLFFHAQKESNILQALRIMILEDMAYLIHVKELSEHISSSISSEQQHKLMLLDLEQYPLKIIQQMEEHENALELLSIQKLFATVFPVGVDESSRLALASAIELPEESPKQKNADSSCSNSQSTSETSATIDLTDIVQDARITLPSLNGWLLGYPVTYLFSKEHAEKAIYNLSSHSLHIFKIFMSRKQSSAFKVHEDELMSFSIPCHLSQRLDKEPWLAACLAHTSEKLKRCQQIWTSVRLDIELKESHQQSIVL